MAIRNTAGRGWMVRKGVRFAGFIMGSPIANSGVVGKIALYHDVSR
jgi:hypothetical protein